MVLTRLQKDVMASIAKNRSDTSYMAGGLVLNMDWPRLSDDMDIFHDTGEAIGAAAERDMDGLRQDGFVVSVEVNVYGCVEATVFRDGQSTLIQWMSESRTRFFPLVRDEEWGARLQHADLAVNKVLAASTRTKARDFVDLIMIDDCFCPLGAVVMAASGKPPHYSPVRIIDEIRRKGLSVSNNDFQSVKGLPKEMTAAAVRDALVAALDRAEAYVRSAPPDIVGLLAVNMQGTPTEISDLKQDGIELRKATAEPDLSPSLPEALSNWNGEPSR